MDLHCFFLHDYGMICQFFFQVAWYRVNMSHPFSIYSTIPILLWRKMLLISILIKFYAVKAGPEFKSKLLENNQNANPQTSF